MRSGVFAVCLLALVGAVVPGCSQGLQSVEPLAGTPEVLVIGDSISIGYHEPLLARLGDEYVAVHNPGNGGDSHNVMTNLHDWVTAIDPDIIHFNCGLHDIKLDRETKTHQRPPAEYEANLRKICGYLTTQTDARLVFALTTPVNDEWHHRNRPFDRRNEDVQAYNRIARSVMQEYGIAVNDLYSVIEKAGPNECLVADGVHMKPEASGTLADAVAEAIRRAAGR